MEKSHVEDEGGYVKSEGSASLLPKKE